MKFSWFFKLAPFAGAALLAGHAHAADLKAAYKAPAPAPVVYSPFAGGYVGVNAGGGWDLGNSAAAFQAVPLGSLANSPQGFLGGGQAGYGLMLNQFFRVGVEGDIDGAALTGSSTLPGLITTDSKNSWLASLRADIGFVLNNNLLLYLTGGWGWGGGQFTVNELFAGGSTASFNPTMDGFTWGGGIKYAFAPQWDIGLKYLQYDFGTATLPSASTLNLVYTTKDRVDTVRAELNFHFNTF